MTAQSDALQAQIEKQIAQAYVALVLEIVAELKKSPGQGGTPVDTGHARANWVPSIGQPFAGEVDTDADAVGRLLGYRLEQGTLWISNNAPYIELLDLGYSHQAPPGFIEAAIERAVATIQLRYQLLDIRIDTRGAGTFVDLKGGAAAQGIASTYSPLGGSDD